MSKKPETIPTETDAPKPRSKKKLALFAVLPLVLAGAGYGGWSFYTTSMMHDAEAAEAEAAGQDHIQVSAVPTEIAAESSFTHSYGLAMIIARPCGTVPVQALKAASDQEAIADGMLASLSWAAAARRTSTLDEKNCRYFLTEIRAADAKAARAISALAAGAQAKGAH